MAYPIPSWIPGAPDIAGNFLRGAQLGSQIQSERARLAQEANLSSMKLALEQQQHERDTQLRQQELAQQQAYQQQQVGLRQQELQQAEQINNIKIQQAARTYQAQQGFQQWLQQNPDKDPAEGILKFFPGTDENLTGAGSLARTLYLGKRSAQPPTVEEADYEGKKYPYLRTTNPEGASQIHWFPKDQASTNPALVRMKIREMEKQRDTLQKTLDTLAPAFEGKSESDFEGPALQRFKQYEAGRKKLDTMQETIDEAYSSGELPQTAGAPGGAGAGDSDFTWNPKTGKIEPAQMGAALNPLPLMRPPRYTPGVQPQDNPLAPPIGK